MVKGVVVGLVICEVLVNDGYYTDGYCSLVLYWVNAISC